MSSSAFDCVKTQTWAFLFSNEGTFLGQFYFSQITIVITLIALFYFTSRPSFHTGFHFYALSSTFYALRNDGRFVKEWLAYWAIVVPLTMVDELLSYLAGPKLGVKGPKVPSAFLPTLQWYFRLIAGLFVLFLSHPSPAPLASLLDSILQRWKTVRVD